VLFIECEEKIKLNTCMFKEQCGGHMVEISYVGIFFGVNNNKDVNVKCSKTMKRNFVTVI
jgi:hypothetical protein